MRPQYNVYTSEGKNKETFTYTLGNKKEVYLFSNYGIPDHKLYDERNANEREALQT